MPRAGFRHATDEQNHGAVHRKGNEGIACEISPGSSASDCRVAGRDHPRPAPFYEQEVVKAFHDLTHESLARSHRAASVKKRRSGVKGRRNLSAATLDAAKAR